MRWTNKLYYGDCFTIMQGMPLGSVDLIYLDPPFKSNRDYNAIYTDETGRLLPDQIQAFCDTWTLNEETERAIRHMPVLMRETGITDEVAEFWRLWMNALRKTNEPLLAYLSYMVQRLLLMKGILKPTGSVYLHCDPTASHYIKVMMDAIFGHDNFRSEVIWKRTGAHGGAKRWGPIHDTLLFYSRGNSYTWNRVYEAYEDDYLRKHYRYEDARGRFQPISLTGPGRRAGSSGQPWRNTAPGDRHWALPSDRALPEWFSPPENYDAMSVQERLDVLDGHGMIYWPERGEIPRFKRYAAIARGNPVQDIIRDIGPLSARAAERMGYDTQKPTALLERIIEASSNPGDVVFDPFCGCATTIEAAHNLGRRWIGIDIAIHAIKRVARVRLQERLRLAEGTDFEIGGVPHNLEGARDMWTRDKYHFQKWAVEQVDGFVTTRRTGDGGIDGRLYFGMPPESATERDPLRSMVIEVKGGKNVGIGVVRDLRGVLEREGAEMAGLIVMDEPGERKRRSFEKEMASAGDLDYYGVLYPRMQLLTVAEIIDGARFKTPGAVGRVDQAALPLI